MQSEDLKFYEDDEGITSDLKLKAFGPDEVQCVNLESELSDKKMKDDILFLLITKMNFCKKLKKQFMSIVSKFTVKNRLILNLLNCTFSQIKKMNMALCSQQKLIVNMELV